MAVNVSKDGSIVVGTTDSPDGIQAFAWADRNGMQGLGHLPSRDFARSEGRAISADGSTIIGSQTSYDRAGGQSSFEGFVYTRDGGMRLLGDASSRWGWNGARRVSGDGSIVMGNGGTLPDGTDSEGFVWDADPGVRTVKAVLESLGVDLTGWRLSAALGISEDGQMIVGYAVDPEGPRRPITAVIPEPGAVFLIGSGLALLACRALRA